MLAVAVAVRVVALLQAHHAPFWNAPIVDEEAYLGLARDILAGKPLPHGAWYQAPGYAYFLAGVLRLGGGAAAVKVLQALLGCFCCLLIWRIARRPFGAAVAVAAGCAWAVAPVALMHEVLLLKPTLSVTLCLAALALLTSAANRVALRWTAAGVAWGAASLLQGEMAGVAAFLLMAGVLARRRSWPLAPTRRALIGYGGGLLLMLAIPTAQNIAHDAGFVVVAYGGGTNFYIGNHHGADGSYLALRPDRSDATVEEGDAVQLAQTASGRPLSAAEVSRFWLRRGLAFWRQEPLAALALTAKKLALVWGAQEQADVLDVPTMARYMPVLRDPIVRPGVILPLALIGVWQTRRRRDLWPLHVFLLGSTLWLAAFFLFERFRMPLTAVALVFAAGAVARAASAWREHQRARVALGTAAAVLVGMLLTLPRVHRDREVLRVNIGGMLLEAGRYDEALAEFKAVRAENPAAWRVDINIATTYALMGQPQPALRTLGTVIPRLQDEAKRTGRVPVEELLHCYVLAGDLQMGLGEVKEAIASYEAAQQLAPGHPVVRQKLEQAKSRAGS